MTATTIMQGYRTSLAWTRFQPIATIGLPFLGIILSELLLFQGFITLALLGHTTVIVFCSIVLYRTTEHQELLAALLMVPIFRLVNLTVPILTDVTLLWLPVVYAPMIPGLLWYLRTERPYDVDWVGTPIRFLLFLPISLTVAVALAPIEYEILRPEALIPIWHPQNVVILGVIMFGFVSLVEELIFRGILQGAFVEKFGSIVGIIAASTLFAVAHAGYGLMPEIGVGFAVGILFGTLYELSDSLLLVILAHGLLNVFIFGLFPIFGPFVVFG